MNGISLIVISESTRNMVLISISYVLLYPREKLSAAIAYSMVSPVYRTSYALLYINKRCYGLYILLETIDSQFLHSRFGSDKGNKRLYFNQYFYRFSPYCLHVPIIGIYSGALYKCSGDLHYLGPDPSKSSAPI